MNNANNPHMTYDRIARFEPQADARQRVREQQKSEYRDELARQIEEKRSRKLDEEKRLKLEEDREARALLRRQQEAQAQIQVPERPKSNIQPSKQPRNDILDVMAKSETNTVISAPHTGTKKEGLQFSRPFSNVESRQRLPEYQQPRVGEWGQMESSGIPGIRTPVQKSQRKAVTQGDIYNAQMDLENQNNAMNTIPAYPRPQKFSSVGDRPTIMAPRMQSYGYPEPQIASGVDQAQIAELKTHILLLKE